MKLIALLMCFCFTDQASAGAAFSSTEGVAAMAGIGAAAMGAQWFATHRLLLVIVFSFATFPILCLMSTILPDCLCFGLHLRAMKDGLGEVGKLLVSKYCSHLFDWYFTSQIHCNAPVGNWRACHHFCLTLSSFFLAHIRIIRIFPCLCSKPKTWRFIGELLAASGGIMMMVPLWYPQHFLAFAALGNALRSAGYALCVCMCVWICAISSATDG
jgi:hypothetical protein